jgi:hypothetical protein
VTVPLPSRSVAYSEYGHGRGSDSIISAAPRSAAFFVKEDRFAQALRGIRDIPEVVHHRRDAE